MRAALTSCVCVCIHYFEYTEKCVWFDTNLKFGQKWNEQLAMDWAGSVGRTSNSFRLVLCVAIASGVSNTKMDSHHGDTTRLQIAMQWFVRHQLHSTVDSQYCHSILVWIWLCCSRRWTHRQMSYSFCLLDIKLILLIYVKYLIRLGDIVSRPCSGGHGETWHTRRELVATVGR